jgi:endonuclease YncB( thermonuclease family)
VIKARLAGINAPECKKKHIRLPSGRHTARCEKDDEFFGQKSYEIIKKLVMGKTVRIKCHSGHDGFCRCGYYGRPLLSFTLDGEDIATLLLAQGGGWAYTKYPQPDTARYCRAELGARKAGKGMWAHGSVKKVMARMSRKTRRWYRHHDAKCRKLMSTSTQ